MQTLTPLGGASEQAPVLVFAHANGYPPESYRLMLEPLAREFRVFTLEHRPFWSEGPAPWRLDWRAYADDLQATLQAHFDEPVWLVGHSMGAIVSMMVALQTSETVRGLVALDPVLLPLKFWSLAQVLVRGLKRDIPIAKVALNRPHGFQSHEEAFEFYRGKRPFRRMSDDALRDYVLSAHHQVDGGGVELRWTGAWEACVYRSAPYMLSQLRNLSLPMLGVAGQHSDVLTAATLKRWVATVPQLQLEVLPGGHLVPVELPDVCADLISSFINKTEAAL